MKPPDLGYATITVLRFPTQEAQHEALRALDALLHVASTLPGLLDCWVVNTGSLEATMITRYVDHAAASAASQQMQQRIGSELGPHVVGPPDRRSGTVLTRSRAQPRDDVA